MGTDERGEDPDVSPAGNTDIATPDAERSPSRSADLAELGAELGRVTAERDALRRLAEARGAALEDLGGWREGFIATASHELKSPLTSIAAYAQILILTVNSPAPDVKRVLEGLSVIHGQAVAMARLLDDLLDVSRMQDGALELRTAPCDLWTCVATVLARLSPPERDRVDVALADAPLTGGWEKGRVEQVLANLIGNALKYSPAGERVGVVAERRPDEIAVSVHDRGMGIASTELPRLFDRFYRTPQAHASAVPGAGLGLYICRGIVAAHGGRLWAESAGEGRGATFRFTLPTGPVASTVSPSAHDVSGQR